MCFIGIYNECAKALVRKEFSKKTFSRICNRHTWKTLWKIRFKITRKSWRNVVNSDVIKGVNYSSHTDVSPVVRELNIFSKYVIHRHVITNMLFDLYHRGSFIYKNITPHQTIFIKNMSPSVHFRITNTNLNDNDDDDDVVMMWWWWDDEMKFYFSN